MTISTRYPTSFSPVSGTWSNQSNLGADDGSVCSITRGTTKNSQDDLTCSDFGFDGDIPAGATINSVAIEVEHRVQSTANVCFLENFGRIGSTDGAVNSDGAEPTTLTARSYTSYARPGGGSWTRDDLLDGTFTVRLRARNGNNASSQTWEWDYVRVVVDYTTTTQYEQSVSGSIASAGALVKRVGAAKAGTLASSGALTKQTAKTLSGAVSSIVGSLAKQAQKVLDGTVTPGGVLTSFKVALVSLAGTLTSAGALQKLTSKTPTGTLTSAGTLVKQTNKSPGGAIALAGSLVKRTLAALTGALASSGALAATKVALVSLAGTLGLSGALVKGTRKSLAGELPASGSLIKRALLSVAGVLTSSGVVSKRTSISISGALSFIGELSTQASGEVIAVVRRIVRAARRNRTVEGEPRVRTHHVKRRHNVVDPED